MTDETFEQAARTYGDMLYRVAYHALKNRADAEDVVQTVLLKLYQQESCFDGEDHMKHWLLRVTVNESRKLLRSFKEAAAAMGVKPSTVQTWLQRARDRLRKTLSESEEEGEGNPYVRPERVP